MERSDPDADLVRAAVAGDAAAFAALVVRHGPLLRTLCRRTLDDLGLAEDAAQEALLRAFLGLDGLRRPERFGPWLAGIGLRVCHTWLRHRTREAWSWEAFVGGTFAAEPTDPAPGPDAIVETADLRQRVRRAVAALPLGQRAAVTLHYLAGLSQAEAAAVLGVEVGAIKTRLHKARASLRRELWRARPERSSSGFASEAGPSSKEAEMVEMRVRDVRRVRTEGELPCRHVIVLEEIGSDRQLPIWIGEFEATAAALQLTRTAHERPLTYAFASAILEAAAGRLREVRIEKLVEAVFYAVAVVAGPAGEQAVDARPSDAVNLALLAGAPIRVAPAVLARTAEGGGQTTWDVVAAESDGAAAIAADATAAQAATHAAAVAAAQPEPGEAE